MTSGLRPGTRRLLHLMTVRISPSGLRPLPAAKNSQIRIRSAYLTNPRLPKMPTNPGVEVATILEFQARAHQQKPLPGQIPSLRPTMIISIPTRPLYRGGSAALFPTNLSCLFLTGLMSTLSKRAPANWHCGPWRPQPPAPPASVPLPPLPRSLELGTKAKGGVSFFGTTLISPGWGCPCRGTEKAQGLLRALLHHRQIVGLVQPLASVRLAPRPWGN